MLKAATWLCLAGWMAGVATGWGAVRYVAPSGGHVSPFVSWGTAATTIQAAVDAAVSGDTILVSNGVYDTGGRVVSGSLTNRVAINKAVTVRSVNGPEVTCIEGRACPTGTVGYGDAAVRCVYLANNAVLDGFTLSNGHTLAKGSYPDDQNSGGGVYAAYASPPNAVVSNCVITGCSAYMAGGGISGGKIVASVVMYNVAEEAGGGAEECHLYNCILHHNLAYGGGGAAYSMLYNCTVTDNVGTNRGGGVSYSTCYNSIMYYNTSAYGANYYYWSYTNCCTTPEPSRGNNIADEPLFVDRANGDYRLMSNSPCINAGLGQAWMAGAGDLDGLPRVVGMSVDIGAYEYQSLTDLLSVEIQASHSQAVVGVAVPFTGVVSGNEQGYVWRMGDGHTHYNVGDVSNVYAAAGSYEVTLTASNLAGAVTATVTVEIVAAGYSYYVAPSGDDAAAGTAWTNAKATLQAGVDAAGLGCVVWVSNGLYNTGGRVCGAGLTNRVTIDKRLMVRSVNGPDATCIAGAADPLTSSNGDAAVRCVYLADEVVLDGFTLSNGYTRMTGDGNLDQSGGGAYCFSTSALITNCVFTHNSAQRNAGACCRGTLDHCWLTDNRAVSYGGGTYVSVHRYCLIENNMARDGAGIANGPAYNCVIRGNIAERNGGGLYASSAHAHNCTVVGNTAGDKGGGAYRINAENCILYYNQAASSDNFYEGNFTNSCAWPAAAGLNNITNAPLLVSMADARLLPDSPCIDRGMNEGWMAGLPDWYGHDRIVNGVVDIGAAEFFGSSALTGALSAVICAGYTQAPVGISVPFVAEIEGAAQGYIWSMGDGTAITNECAFAHAYGAPGYLDVTLTVSNLTDRITVTQQVAILLEDCDYYVRPDGDDGADGTTWATAKATIQAAVDTADMGCVIWVSNGLYAAGGVALHAGLTNRVTVDRLVTVRSVNGPAVTTIAGQECATNGACGDGAVRCVYLADGAALIGFTLTNGHTLALGTEQRQGGGVWCAGSGAVISNCVISGCRAADYGGGCRGGALYDTLLRGNRARYGGGVSEAVLYACGITNNLAGRGGGAYDCDIHASDISDNHATNNSGGGVYRGTLTDCTLADNTARDAGGGAREAWLIDCVVTGNAVLDNSSDGGGAYGGAVEGCVIAGNTALGAASRGGGLAEATCSQSTLTSNQAIYGGGSFGGVLSNCTIDCNTAQFGGGGYDGTFYQCQLTGNTASNGGGLFEGAGYDCVFSNNATLGANGYGGGASQSELHRCRLLNNTAYQGGGARLCELYNCLLAANQADYGGGAASCDAVNCTVVNNDAVTFGGGAFWGTFRNSIVYYNTAFASHNCYESVCTNSCASPLPAGTNNITAAPGFADYAAGDFTLASDSDCIDRGTNQAWMVTGYDLDGNARLFNAIVDMGAYEFSNATLDSDGDGILDIYETDTGVYAGATDTGTDPLVADTDGDNMPDGDEVAAGTDPTDNASWLGMMAPVTLYDGGYVIAWQSASNRSYRVERATNMLTGFDAVIQTNIPATPYINTITDITASASSIYLYRVRTELEE